MSIKIRKQDALDYHTKGQPGKIEVTPTKQLSTQLDLALAYSPGVAEPCKEIAANKEALTPTGLMNKSKVNYKTAWIVCKKFIHALPIEALNEDDENWWTFDRIADYIMSGAEISKAYRGLFQRGHSHIKSELQEWNYPDQNAKCPTPA